MNTMSGEIVMDNYYFSADPKVRRAQEAALKFSQQPEKPPIQTYIDNQHVKHVNQVINKYLKHDQHVKHGTRPNKNTSPIYEKIDTDPVLQMAVGWGVWRDTLYKYCKALGTPKVQAFIRMVGTDPTVGHPASYLTGVLQKQLDQLSGVTTPRKRKAGR